MENFKILSNEFGIIFAVSVDVNGNNWKEFGSKEKLAFQGIVNHYFPNPNIANQLHDFLKESVLPQIFSQGKVLLILTMLNKDRIVGLFMHNEEETLEQIMLSRKVNAKLKETPI